jgi:hypothetical protein
VLGSTKEAANLASAIDSTFSPVRFASQNLESCAHFAQFPKNPGEFLYTSTPPKLQNARVEYASVYRLQGMYEFLATEHPCSWAGQKHVAVSGLEEPSKGNAL